MWREWVRNWMTWYSIWAQPNGHATLSASGLRCKYDNCATYQSGAEPRTMSNISTRSLYITQWLSIVLSYYCVVCHLFLMTYGVRYLLSESCKWCLLLVICFTRLFLSTFYNDRFVSYSSFEYRQNVCGCHLCPRYGERVLYASRYTFKLANDVKDEVKTRIEKL